MIKKTVRKLISVLSIFIFSFGLFPGTSNAAEALPNQSSTIEKADEYVNDNIDTLVERVRGTASTYTVAELVSDTGEVYELPVYKIDTTDVICQYDSNLDLKSVTYAIDTTDIAAASGNKNSTDWDSTSSVKAYTTIYYTSSGNPTYYLLTSVKGGYSIEDGQVKVTSQRVVMGCTDWRTVQTITKNPTTNSWSYSPGFTDSVLYTQMLLGCTYYLTLQHVSGGTTWTLSFNNNL